MPFQSKDSQIKAIQSRLEGTSLLHKHFALTSPIDFLRNVLSLRIPFRSSYRLSSPWLMGCIEIFSWDRSWIPLGFVTSKQQPFQYVYVMFLLHIPLLIAWP